MEKRKPISKRLRFEVLKRDNFTCQYCSSKPPKVPLEVDHIHPISKGGKNEIDNLITACFDCNRGKSDVELTSIPDTLIEKTERKRIALEQYKQYQKFVKAQQKIINDEIMQVELCFNRFYLGYSFTDRFNISVKRFISVLGVEQVIENMESACIKVYYDHNQATKYFCGICWNQIKERGL